MPHASLASTGLNFLSCHKQPHSIFLSLSSSLCSFFYLPFSLLLFPFMPFLSSLCLSISSPIQLIGTAPLTMPTPNSITSSSGPAYLWQVLFFPQNSPCLVLTGHIAQIHMSFQPWKSPYYTPLPYLLWSHIKVSSHPRGWRETWKRQQSQHMSKDTETFRILKTEKR